MKKSGLHIDAYGAKRWYINNKLHRKDGPAVEFTNGSKYWYLNGKLHREGGPAAEWSDGTKRWYVHGKRHRLDGPAEEWKDGVVAWYLDDIYLGDNAVGFWRLWDQLTPEQQNNLNLHQWMKKCM